MIHAVGEWKEWIVLKAAKEAKGPFVSADKSGGDEQSSDLRFQFCFFVPSLPPLPFFSPSQQPPAVISHPPELEFADIYLQTLVSVSSSWDELPVFSCNFVNVCVLVSDLFVLLYLSLCAPRAFSCGFLKQIVFAAFFLFRLSSLPSSPPVFPVLFFHLSPSFPEGNTSKKYRMEKQLNQSFPGCLHSPPQQSKDFISVHLVCFFLSHRVLCLFLPLRKTVAVH